MSRDLNMATPRIRAFAEKFITEAKRILNLDVFIIEVDRPFEVQVAYYAQGRESLDVVNSLRKRAGLNPISEKANQRIVTKTMKSKHIINLANEATSDDLSRAIDFGLIDRKGVYHGEPKADLNKDGKLDYIQLGIIGKMIDSGLIWGGDFKGFKDYAHWEEPDEQNV